MNIVSERIYQAIKRAGLSYGELSEMTGIPKSALQRYATGETDNIRIERIWKIAEATHTPAGWLINWLDFDEEPQLQLSPEEETLIHFYKRADPRYQELALELLMEHPNRDNQEETDAHEEEKKDR